MSESIEMLEDWEDWDPESGTSFFVHALAGSLAGGAEHCAMYPIDTIKTHMQAARSEGTPFQIVKNLVGSNFGVLRMWRGVSTMLTACVPAHAAYFSIFEYCKAAFGADGTDHAPLAAAASGILGTLVHDSIMTPMDVAKQRLQLGFYKGPIDCIKSVIRTEGVRSLYLSYPTTLLMNIPYAGVMVATNESAKKILNPNNEYSVKAFMVSGGIAGMVAACATNPLDVVKTRLQTQALLNDFPNCSNKTGIDHIPDQKFGRFAQVNYSLMDGRLQMHRKANFIDGFKGYGVRCTYTAPSKLDCVCNPVVTNVQAVENGSNFMKYTGFSETVKKIFQEEGLRGFARGCGSRVLVQAPSVAISWTTYETAKKALTSMTS